MSCYHQTPRRRTRTSDERYPSTPKCPHSAGDNFYGKMAEFEAGTDIIHPEHPTVTSFKRPFIIAATLRQCACLALNKLLDGYQHIPQLLVHINSWRQIAQPHCSIHLGGFGIEH